MQETARWKELATFQAIEAIHAVAAPISSRCRILRSAMIEGAGSDCRSARRAGSGGGGQAAAWRSISSARRAVDSSCGI